MSGMLSNVARLQGMSDDVWERHSNPLSGWSRVPILPVFIALLFWRDALGPLMYIGLAVLALWTWYNPRAFPRPKSTDNWMSRAVMGERIWLNRSNVPVPAHYSRAIPVILVIAFAGLPLIGFGLWYDYVWPLLFGLTLCMVAKFWFLDRMVWLYDDMSASHPIYKAWLY